MAVIITMPDEIENQLQRKAEKEHQSLEEFILGLLTDALESETPFPTPEEVVAKIKATPGNPNNLRPSSGSLAEALHQAPDDPDFNLATWNRAWAAVESEMHVVTRTNASAENRT